MRKTLIIIQLFFLFFFSQFLVIFAQSIATPKKYIYIKPSKIQNFVNKLNEYGKLGYKLKTVSRATNISYPENPLAIEVAGIIELYEGSMFEYEWFESDTISKIEQQLVQKGNKGFYFNSRLGYSLVKPIEVPSVKKSKPGTPERDKEILNEAIKDIRRMLSNEPIDGNIFFLERKDKISEIVEFRFVTPEATTSIFKTSVIDYKKITPAIENSISNIDTRSFYPVSNFYSSKIFLTRISHLPTILLQKLDEEPKNYPTEYKVIESIWAFGTFKKKLTDAGNLGIEILSIVNNFAVIKLNEDRKASYYWIETQNKSFLKDLADISAKGGRFIANQETSDFMARFVFEQYINDDGKRFDYKVLNIVPLTSLRGTTYSSYEFDELVNQGYQPKSLFYNNGMNVLFEKLKN